MPSPRIRLVRALFVGAAMTILSAAQAKRLRNNQVSRALVDAGFRSRQTRLGDPSAGCQARAR